MKGPEEEEPDRLENSVEGNFMVAKKGMFQQEKSLGQCQRPQRGQASPGPKYIHWI